MTRAPSYLDDNTRTFARTCPGFGKTQAQMALAIEVYRTPLHKRVLWAICRTGWLILPAVLAVLAFSGCTSDVDTYAAMQADLADAVAQTQAIQREQQAKADAERREAEAVAAEQRLVAVIAEAEAREAKRREADKAHKTAINRAALDAFMAGGMTEECAKLAVTLIAKKAIPAVSITY